MSNELKESQKYDYTTSGALTDDCFQVIVTIPPDKALKTMADQRETAFIKAKGSIAEETEKQVLSYYSADKSISIDKIPLEKTNFLKEKSNEYAKQAIVEQEFYLIDNSAVLVYRIFKKGIKSDILNN